MNEMERFGESLDRYLGNTGLKIQLEKHFFLNTWYNVVGHHIARHTRPVAIREKKLIIAVKDSAWLHHLTFLKMKIIEDFNRAAGEKVIEDIRFRNEDFPLGEKPGKTVEMSSEGQSLPGTSKNLLFQNRARIRISPLQEDTIERCLLHAPDALQSTIKSLLEKSFIYQKRKLENGAQLCGVCEFPFFENERRENLCFLCDNHVKSWRKPIHSRLHQKPWMGYLEMKAYFPHLEEKIFQRCRDMLLSRYAERMRQLLANHLIPEQNKRNALQRLALRYVLLLEEKDPTRVAQDDLDKALKPFPGLKTYLWYHQDV